MMTIAEMVGVLHNASLMVDDIEDGSRLRRGVPVCHSIFGIPNTINTANYMYARPPTIYRSSSPNFYFSILIPLTGTSLRCRRSTTSAERKPPLSSSRSSSIFIAARSFSFFVFNFHTLILILHYPGLRHLLERQQ